MERNEEKNGVCNEVNAEENNVQNSQESQEPAQEQETDGTADENGDNGDEASDKQRKPWFKVVNGLWIILSLLFMASAIYGAIKFVQHIRHKDHYALDYEYVEEPSAGPVTYKNGQTNIVNPSTDKVIVKDVDWVHYENNRDTIILFAKDGKRGFCNIETNKVIVEPTTYTKAWIFSEGLAAVEKDGYIGFVNTKGEVAIDFKFRYRGNSLTEFVFHNGHCVVANPNNRIGVIDTKGRWVLDPEYDEVELTKDYAIVYTEGDFKKQVDYSGKVLLDGIIDYIEPLHYDVSYTDITTGSPEDGRARNSEYYEYRVGDFAGLINSRGQFITPPIYTSINGVSPTLFSATLQDGWSKVFIDQNGNVISGK